MSRQNQPGGIGNGVVRNGGRVPSATASTNQPGGIGNSVVRNGGRVPSATASTATVTAELTAAQRQTIQERATDRYCPDCGTHYRAKDVKWIRGTPACRVCGFKPLRKVNR